MTAKRIITAVLFTILFYNFAFGVNAQDTFGPTCDGVTVTCVPTATPTAGPAPTDTPIPTPTDTPTPTPTEPPPSPTPTGLPRAGNTGPLNFVFMISAALIAGGLLSRFAFLKKS